MELGPIGGFRPVAASEPKVTDIELPAVSQIDNSSRPGKYSSSRRQAPGRQDGDDSQFAEAAPEEVPADPAASDADPESNISFFA